MSGLIFVLVIVYIIFAVLGNKKAAANKAKQRQNTSANPVRAQQANQRPAGNAVSSAPKKKLGNPWICTCGYENSAGSKFCHQCGKKFAPAVAQSGSLDYNSSEGLSTEGESAARGTTLRHVVKPMTESHHSHTESSMAGRDVPCEDSYAETEAADAYSSTEQSTAYSVDITNRERIIQGVLYSEILGKPKALRK